MALVYHRARIYRSPAFSCLLLDSQSRSLHEIQSAHIRSALDLNQGMNRCVFMEVRFPVLYGANKCLV